LILRADLLKGQQPLKAPGVKVDCQRVPLLPGEHAESVRRRLGTMHLERHIGRFKDSLGEFQPGRAFAQE